MRTVPARLLIGATFLVAGFGVLTDGSPLRIMDFKDRECRTASVALSSACPAGCMPRPLNEPSDRTKPTECRSRLWVRTCGKDCEPSPGYARASDGALVDGRRIVLALEAEPDAALEGVLQELGATLETRFDGMFRYDVTLSADAADLKETKKRLSALPGVRSVEYLPR